MSERVLTLEQIEQIERGCEGVTPGPWSGGGFMVTGVQVAPHCRVTVAHTGIVGNPPPHAPTDERNAAHIRRLDPTTVKALCALARAALSATPTEE